MSEWDGADGGGGEKQRVDGVRTREASSITVKTHLSSKHARTRWAAEQERDVI